MSVNSLLQPTCAVTRGRLRAYRTVVQVFAFALAATVVANPTGSARHDDKVLLRLLGTKGQTASYRAEWQMSLQAGPGRVVVGTVEESDVTVTDAQTGGGVTTEHKTTSSTTTINGQAQPAEEGHGKTTIKQAPNGLITSYVDSEADQDDPNNALNVRLSTMGTVIFSDKPVGVGDKWSIDVPADKDSGRPAGHGDYEVLGAEDLKGAKCLKIKLDYAEKGVTPALHQIGTAWVEIASGDTLQDNFKITGLVIKAEDGEMSGDATGHSGRTGGTLLASAPAQKADQKPAETEKPSADQFDSKVKGMDKAEGLFTLYTKSKDNRTTAYLEVKDDQLNKPLLLQATAATGTGDGRVTAGDPLADLVFELRKSPTGKVIMTVPNTKFRTTADTPMARALKRSFSDTNLDALTVEASNPERKSVLIDVSSLFMNDIGQVQAQLMGPPMFGGPAGGPFVMDREKSYVSSFRSLPENLAVRSVYSFISGRGAQPGASGQADSTLADPHGAIVAVEYSLAPLPIHNGYRTRVYDQRVGYFTSDYDDYSNDTKLERTKKLINRWDLRKKDPRATVSEPVRPIVFWISNDVPTEYRDTVKEAVLSWNSALEQCGFKDAIQVKQMPDDADWDPSDVRYNVVRWVTSPDNAYAVTYDRVNPITGQILNAQIVVDANMTRGTAAEKQFLINPEAVFARLDPNRKVTLNRARCEIGQAGWMVRTVGMFAAEDLGIIDQQEYVKQALRHTVAHEMGHVLGLRHNFAASTTYSMDQLKDAKGVEAHGVASSLMDYLPFNLAAAAHPGTPFYVAKPGVYDDWAVKYGYSEFDTPSAKDDDGFLQRIASESGQQGKVYLSDEFADGVDPDVSRFDLTKQPVDYWIGYADLLHGLTYKLKDVAPRNGESYFDLTRRYFAYLNQYISSAAELTRFVGGVEKSAGKKGDSNAGPPIMPVDASTQRKAIAALNRLYLGPDAFDFPKDLYSKFQSNPTATEEQGMANVGEYFPVVQRYMLVQRLVLRTLLGSDTMARVQEQEFKAQDPSKTLTLSELFQDVSQSVWAEADKGQAVGPMRRQLQRNHLQTVIDMSLGRTTAPDDARALALNELRVLGKKIKMALPKATGATRLHYEDCLARIARALDAKETIGGSTGISLKDLLGG